MFALRALLVALSVATFARASIYVTGPSTGSTCHGGQVCQVQWLDDGEAPLLSSTGVCNVGLYAHTMHLLQPLGSVNVSDVHSFSFTPNPKSGPNYSGYYLAFVPTPNASYTGFSPSFTLDNMTGSFNSSMLSDTMSTSSPATSPSGPSHSTTGTQTTTTMTTTSSGISSSTHSGTSSSSTTSTTPSASTKTNAAAPNGSPATGFAWTIMVSLFSAAFFF